MASMIMMVFVASVVAGCATGPKGPTDQELITTTVKSFTEALLLKNIDALMATVSENFYHPEVGDKAAAKDMLGQGMDSGYVDDGAIDLDNMAIKIEGDTAEAYPIVASAPAGSVTVGLTLKKENGAWLITAINVEGI